ncbi:MAG: ABC transporter ATP-binding protein [Chloroflexi bacterium]|nr:ABC transporter ATP-binding protein [Chloroflexota bacterium]
MIAIETRGLTRYYGDLCAVDHLDLEVGQGELFGFLGPNGAGKTTTIRMLTGLIRPTEGTARVGGHDVARDVLAVKSLVGMVPQRSSLYAELSARDNLIFVAKLYGLPRAEWRPRAEALLAQVGLAERADSQFRTLSGGMKRRLTIAAALVQRPAILFLDEPTTGLDVQAARGIRRLVAGLRNAGVTVFLTTHLISEAEALADRVAIIVRGRLVALDSPAALCAACSTQILLEAEVVAPDAALLQALAALPSVEEITPRSDRLILRLAALREGLAEVAAVLQARGSDIRSVRTVVPSLEEAFVHLTHLDAEAMQRNGGGAPNGGQA